MRSMVWKWNNWLSGIAFSLSLCSRMAQCDRQCVTWRVINSRVEWGVNIFAGKFDLPQWKLYRCWTEVPNRGGITVRNVLVSPRLILFRWKPGFDLVTRFQPLRFSFKPAAKYRAGLSVDSLLFGNFFFFFFFAKSRWLLDTKPALWRGTLFLVFSNHRLLFRYIFLKFLLVEIFEYRYLYLSKKIFIVDIRILFFNKNSSSVIRYIGFDQYYLLF